MKFILVVLFALIPSAFAEGEKSVSLTKTDEVVTLSQESAQDLFGRIRGAHSRAMQSGRVSTSKAAKSS